MKNKSKYEKMTTLFIGDVVGFSGLQCLIRSFDELKQRYSPDCIIVNGENIVNGKGLSEKEAQQLFDAGTTAITTGNHVWENWLSRPLLASHPNVLRPMNYPQGNPGRGFTILTLPNSQTVGVIQLQGRTYMQPIDCPFRAADFALSKMKSCVAIIVDFHAEATSEKIAFARMLDGKVSAVVGTHTHVQTADEQIFPGGTAYLTDAGFTGPHEGVLGREIEPVIKRFVTNMPQRFEVAKNNIILHGVVVTVDESNGKAAAIERVSERLD